MQSKKPVTQRTHTPTLPHDDHVILREYFHTWKINDLIDTLIHTIPFDQQKNMVTNIKRRATR